MSLQYTFPLLFLKLIDTQHYLKIYVTERVVGMSIGSAFELLLFT